MHYFWLNTLGTQKVQCVKLYLEKLILINT